MHDMRRTLYSRMFSGFRWRTTTEQTGDLISRVTGDIDSVQTFITSGLLGALINMLTLVGMIGVMFYINWKFTLIALSVVPVLFAVVFTYTRASRKPRGTCAKKKARWLR